MLIIIAGTLLIMLTATVVFASCIAGKHADEIAGYEENCPRERE